MKNTVRIQLAFLAGLFLSAVPSSAADIVWTNLTSSVWNATTNWSPNQVPGSTDSAFITNNGTYTVTLNVAAILNSFTIGGAAGTQTFLNSSQILTLNGASSVNSNGIITLDGGTLTGGGDLVVNGTLQWATGTMSGSGTTFANNTLSLLPSPGDKTINTGRRLVNAGAALWSGGRINIANGSLLTNAGSGTFDISFDGSTIVSAGAGTVANAGLLRQTAGTNGTIISGAFLNSGTVQVLAGALSFNSGGTNSATLSVAPGATFAFTGGTFTALPGSSLSGAGNVLFGGGTVNITGDVNVSGTNTITGTVNFNPGGTVTLGTLGLNGGTLGGTNDVTVTGLMSWTTGTITGTNSVFANGGLSLLNSASDKNLTTGRRIVNAGAALWSGGRINIANGGLLTNAASGTFDINFDANIIVGSGVGTFANAGLFRQTTGTNGTTITATFNNAASVQVLGGSLSLNGGGAQDGTFGISAGAKLEFGGGTHTVSSGCSIFGAGNFEVSAGTANLSGAFNISSTNQFTGGTASFLGAYNIAGGTIAVQGGTVNFNGSGPVNPALLIITSGTLGGTNDITITGPIAWTSGTIAGSSSVFANGGLSLLPSASDKTLNTGRRLINAGAALWSGGRINIANGSLLTNAASGTFDISFDGSTIVSAGAGTIANAGLFRQTAGTNGAIISGAAFLNVGTVQVLAAALSLNAGGTNSGSFSVAAGSTLTFGGGTHTLLPGSSLASSGTVSFAAGTVNIFGDATLMGTNSVSGTVSFNSGGTVALGTLIQSAGTLGGTNELTVSGPMTWSGGTISGANNIIANGGLTLSGAAKVLAGRTLVNNAAAIWNGGSLSPATGAISNSATGTFDLSLDGNTPFGGAAFTFANAGLFRKTGGTNSFTFSSPDLFNNSGTVEVQTGTLSFGSVYTQTAGLTLLNGGTIANTVPLRIQGGALAGTNVIAGSVTNSGALSPGASPGKLTITGAYTQTAAGVLNIELGGNSPGTNFDLLVVSGVSTLAGALNVTFVNGFYPATNAAFTFLTNASHNGTFTAFNYPSNDVGMQVSYATTNATITVVNVRPVLPAVGAQTNSELALFSLNTAATDDDAPAQTLTYALTNSPAGASISGSGLVTWIPTEAQGPMSTNLTVLVTDSGSPNLTVSRTFPIVINEVNEAPVLTLPPNQALNEQTTFSANATAIDADIPINPLTFALVSGPVGLTVSSNGAISWTPTEMDGPGVYVVTVSVTDLNTNAVNSQQLSQTNCFTLTVNEVNLPPVLVVPTNQTVLEETTLVVLASASDPDLPSNPLTFALISPPAGMTINPTTGAISWTPTESQGPSTNLITVTVTDTNAAAVNAQHLSATNSFFVIVNEVNRTPVLTLPPDQVIHAGTMLSTNATATDPDLPANTLAFALVSGPAALNISSAGQITWTPGDSFANTTNTVRVRVMDNGSPNLSATGTFNIRVASRPIIDSPLVAGASALLSWSAIPGQHYRLNFASDVNSTNWLILTGDVIADNTNATKLDSTISGAITRFYRVEILP